MRKNYIDNLRWFSVLLLFPYHAAMMYNDWGESFYVYNKAIKSISAFIIATYTWFMPLLFVLAGISSCYALQKRTPKEYVKERFEKLFIPLIFGILLLVPVQTFYAECFHNGYTGSYFEQYILFFTKFSDLTGYTGGFTIGHLWFIQFLFVISLVALPLMRIYLKSERKLDGKRMTFIKLIPLFVIPLLMSLVLDFGGKSVGKYFSLFMLGFLIFSNNDVIDRLEKNRWTLFISAIMLIIAKLVTYFGFGFAKGNLVGVFDNFIMWICIMAFLGMGKRYFNGRTKVTDYLSKASFPIYILHQSCLVATAYYVMHFVSTVAVQYFLIIFISAVVTFAVYEIFKRIPVTRFIFAIKK